MLPSHTLVPWRYGAPKCCLSYKEIAERLARGPHLEPKWCTLETPFGIVSVSVATMQKMRSHPGAIILCKSIGPQRHLYEKSPLQAAKWFRPRPEQSSPQYPVG